MFGLFMAWICEWINIIYATLVRRLEYSQLLWECILVYIRQPKGQFGYSVGSHDGGKSRGTLA